MPWLDFFVIGAILGFFKESKHLKYDELMYDLDLDN